MSFEKVLMNTPAFQRYIEDRDRKVATKAAENAARDTERATALKHIELCLSTRFGAVPQKLVDRLQSIKDQTRLDSLLETAMVCADLKAFTKAVNK